MVIQPFFSHALDLRYTPAEAEWALAEGHLDSAWEGPLVDKKTDPILASVLQKDLAVVANTGQLCNSVLVSVAVAFHDLFLS